MTKRILVALSGTPFTPSAIETALELGREHDAEVTGVTVIDVARLEDVGPVPLGGSAAALDLTEHRRHVTEERIEEQVSRFEAACAEQGTIHRVIRETGDAMEELMGLWRYHDVTVVGLRGLFDYGIFRDPHDKIIALLAKGVRPILAVAEKPRRVERVLIAYSGSMESAMAMKRFVQLHLWPNTTLGIAHFDRGEAASHRLVDDAVAYCRAHGFETEPLHWPGPTKGRLLPNAAGWGADMIVLGSSARHKLARLILGDTVHEVIRGAEIPLFLSQ